MTIRQMAVAQRAQETAASTSKKYSAAKGEHPHPYGIEGLCLACYGEHKHDKVTLSDSAVQQVKNAALESAKDGYGWNDGDYLSPIIKSYVQTVDLDKRLASSYSLQQVWRDEVDRIGWYIHSQDPSWTNWGQRFDISILDNYRQGIDVRA